MVTLFTCYIENSRLNIFLFFWGINCEFVAGKLNDAFRIISFHLTKRCINITYQFHKNSFTCSCTFIIPLRREKLENPSRQNPPRVSFTYQLRRSKTSLLTSSLTILALSVLDQPPDDSPHVVVLRHGSYAKLSHAIFSLKLHRYNTPLRNVMDRRLYSILSQLLRALVS